MGRWRVAGRQAPQQRRRDRLGTDESATLASGLLPEGTSRRLERSSKFAVKAVAVGFQGQLKLGQLGEREVNVGEMEGTKLLLMHS